ncbi:adenylate/guanylate cyclase domain protein (macronuclear) [Tetrahymena thermophila SB210]|uniref:adenylate cyclase n=1 Tax=Tetrahymena thermophila (strain SB210) TaxID=312017 RepID=Q23TD7_TETTS|nr:adenylate/guanylate cyclase domain protein [Tetrahymena thermophila SB210]EAR99769.2 adenylate/guanylate cyclase domain protein [Tetrahymena thermophila SB210]|eukprot:XP_001020014.2 adenylate/guanylate cyclase domain protein [Tetrahymena thermophila SB210]
MLNENSNEKLDFNTITFKKKKKSKDQLRMFDINEGKTIYKGLHIRRQLESNKQIYFKIIMTSFFTSFYKIGNLIYFIILLMVIFEQQLDTSQAYYLLVPLILNFSVHGFKNFQLYRSKIKQNSDSKIQTQIVHKLVYGQVSYFNDISQDKVEIGDIILLKKNEICTSDILVIASKEQKIIVETNEIDGVLDYRQIKPVDSTNEENISIETILKSYKYTLNGKIEYYPILKEAKLFEGYIKLESDPKGEKLSFQNIIQRGSYLKNTDWVLGIVIDYGYLNTVLSVKHVKIARDQYLLKFMNRFIQMTTIWISFAIFSVIFWKNIRQTQPTIANSTNKDQYVALLESITVYSQGIPVLLYAILHASYYIIKYQIEKKYKNKNQEVEINNSGAITNLSHVDIAVFSLSGAFLHPDKNDIINGVYINNKFYSAFDHSNYRQSLKNLQEDEYLDSPSPMNQANQFQKGISNQVNSYLVNGKDSQAQKKISTQSFPQMDTNLLKINDLGKQHENSNNNIEYDSDDDESSNSKASQKNKTSERDEKKQNKNVFRKETCEIQDHETDERKKQPTSQQEDQSSMYEKISLNLNHLKESLNWNNKNKFTSMNGYSSPINRSQANIIQNIFPNSSNTNLFNTSIQNVSIQNQSNNFNGLLQYTLNSLKSTKHNLQNIQYNINDQQLSILKEDNTMVSNFKTNKNDNTSYEDSQKHDNASEHADAVPNLIFNNESNIKPNGYSSHNSSPVIAEESIKNISVVKNETYNNNFHIESQNQLSSFQLEKPFPVKNANIQIDQLDAGSPINKKTDQQNMEEINNVSLLNFTKNLHTININGNLDDQEYKNPLEQIPEQEIENKDKKCKNNNQKNLKRLEVNTSNHKESINNHSQNENLSEERYQTNGSNQNQNGRVNGKQNDSYLQVVKQKPRRKASSQIPNNTNNITSTENINLKVNSPQKTLHPPLNIQIPNKEFQISLRNQHSDKGSFLKNYGNVANSPSPSTINKSFFGGVIPRQTRAPSSNLNHNRSFNIFTSPNQFVQTTLNNPTHQSFHHNRQNQFQTGEIVRWKDLYLYPFYPQTRPPRLDDKNKLTELLTLTDNQNATQRESMIKIEFFKALALCHNVKTKKLAERILDQVQENDNDDRPNYQEEANNSKYKLEPTSKDEIPQLELSQKSGLSFLRGGFYKHKQFYDLKYKEKIIRYEVKQTYLPNESRKFFGILVKVDDKHLISLLPATSNLSQFNSKKNATSNNGNQQNQFQQFVEFEPKDLQLFVKGSAQEILPRCQLTKFQKDLILKDMHSQQIRGMKMICFAKKNMKELDQKQDTDQIATGMEFLGSMCLSQQLIPKTQELVSLLQSAGIVNWLISADSQSSVLAAGYKSNMIHHDTTFLTIDQSNVEELKYQIKNHLFLLQNLILEEEEMNFQPESGNKVSQGQSMRAITKEQYKRRMSNLNNSRKGSSYISTGSGSDQEKLEKISLLVDGSSLKVILSNDYLKAHFQFLCLVCNNLLGYNFCPSSKSSLISLIQQTKDSKTTVISFGYGSKDSQMMNQSNFSFLIKGQSTCQSYIGDVTLKDFSLVRDFIFDDSIEVSDKLQYLVVTNTKLIIFIMFLNYFYQLHNYQIQSDLVKGYQITLNIYASQTIGSLYILLSSFKNNPQNCLIRLRPEFYKFRRNQNSWMKSHFLECMLFVTFHAFLTSLLLENPLMGNYTLDGKLIDYEITQGIMSFVMGIVLIFIVMAGPMQQSIVLSTIFIFTQIIISLLPSIFKVVEEQTNQPYIFSYLFNLLQSFSIIFIMLTIYFIEYFFTKFFRYYFIPEQFMEVFNSYTNRFNPERVKTFFDKMKSTVHEVRVSQQFLTQILKQLFTKTEIDPFLRKILDPSQKVDSYSNMSKFTLQFNDLRVEKNYKEFRMQIFTQKFAVVMIIIAILLMSSTIIEAVQGLTGYGDTNEASYIFNSFLIYSRILIQFIIIFVSVAIVFKKTLIFSIDSATLVNVIYHYCLPFVIVNYGLYSIFKKTEIDLIGSAFIISIYNWDSVPPPIILSYSVCIINTIGVLISISMSSKFNNGVSSTTKNQLLFIISYIFYVLHSFLYFYMQEKARRISFSTKNRIKYEENEVDHVLANLLPPFVRTRFNSSGNASIEEDQGEVAILFLDICDFDSILNEEQTKLIKWIDNLYRQFDKICVEYGVQKIETVGKIYMACAGLKLTKEEKLRQQKMLLTENETERLVLAAQEMQIKAKQYFWGNNQQTDVKIGIHYGKVIAGVIGAHKPQFSLIGDTVNTASRVCSKCKEKRISLSYEAHRRLGKTEWLFLEKEVEAKGKGILKIFSLAENIRNTIIKVNNDALNSKKNSLNNKQLFSKNSEGFHSKNNLNNVSMHSQNLSAQSGSLRSFRNSLDNGIQQQASSNQQIQYTQPNNQLSNISRKSAVQRNASKKNKTFVSSTDLNNELGELVANDEVNSSFQQAKNQNNESGKFQIGSNNSANSNQAKRKLRYSRTMLIQPRNSLQNTLAIQKLDTLEIFDEEIEPETKKFEERERHTLARKDTIVLTNQKRQDKEQGQYSSEPLLQVSQYLLRYLNGRNDDIVKKFELGTSTDSTQQFGLKSHFFQFSIHLLVIIVVFLNLELLSTQAQILLLILKAIECGVALFAIIFIPKLASRVLTHKIVLHLYAMFSHINSIVLSRQFLSNQGILGIIFIEHLIVLNMIQEFSFIHFNQTFLHASVIIGLWLANFYDTGSYEDMVKICILVIFEIYKCYVRWDVKIENFNNLIAHEIKKSEKDNLLKYLVPKHILTQFLQNKKQYKEISESLEKVTLLFADIAGFTSYSSNKQPSEVVKMLRNLFTSFDQLCLKHKVYKVYTIGDCYVVIGIVDKQNRQYQEECKNVIQMGFSMIQVIENIKREHEDFKSVNMRIGIHLGEKVLGGIIGTNIVRYDIFGKDVVIANKMESNGQLGRINISEDTKKFLENHYPNEYRYEENKEVELTNFKQENNQTLKVKSYFIEQGDFINKTQTEDDQ